MKINRCVVILLTTCMKWCNELLLIRIFHSQIVTILAERQFIVFYEYTKNSDFTQWLLFLGIVFKLFYMVMYVAIYVFFN